MTMAHEIISRLDRLETPGSVRVTSMLVPRIRKRVENDEKDLACPLAKD
jgi:hypothetical protein